MRLYYIRHAQSANNHRWDQTESSEGREPDPELTERGRQQLEPLAACMRQHDPCTDRADEPLAITHLYSSLMVRAVETGCALSRALNLPLVAWTDLHERGGLWDFDAEGERVGIAGPGRSFFERRFPDLILPQDLDEQGWWNRPKESLEEVSGRVHRILAKLREEHESTDRVAVVAHGGLYNSMLRVLLDIKTERRYWIELNNAALSRIDFRDDTLALVYSNRTNHLPSDLLT